MIAFSALDDSEYTNIATSFSYVVSTSIYQFSTSYFYDYFDARLDTTNYDNFFASYDGYTLGLYVYIENYDWEYNSATYDTHSFGACIGEYCAGAWASSYYYSLGST